MYHCILSTHVPLHHVHPHALAAHDCTTPKITGLLAIPHHLWVTGHRVGVTGQQAIPNHLLVTRYCDSTPPTSQQDTMESQDNKQFHTTFKSQDTMHFHITWVTGQQAIPHHLLVTRHCDTTPPTSHETPCTFTPPESQDIMQFHTIWVTGHHAIPHHL